MFNHKLNLKYDTCFFFLILDKKTIHFLYVWCILCIRVVRYCCFWRLYSYNEYYDLKKVVYNTITRICYIFMPGSIYWVIGFWMGEPLQSFLTKQVRLINFLLSRFLRMCLHPTFKSLLHACASKFVCDLSTITF